MPELPEIETLSRELSAVLLGKKIESYIQNRDNLRAPIQKNIANQIENKRILKISRRGKYLLFYVDSDVLLFHLGMSGRIFLENSEFYIPKKHDHIIIRFICGALLVFSDPRRFGMIYHTQQENLLNLRPIQNLGPEPFSEEFNAEYLYKVFAKRKTVKIKPVLMENKLVVGAGNIYAQESLFRANINPERFASTLSYTGIERLIKMLKSVLLEAINAQGTTFVTLEE